MRDFFPGFSVPRFSVAGLSVPGDFVPPLCCFDFFLHVLPNRFRSPIILAGSDLGGKVFARLENESLMILIFPRIGSAAHGAVSAKEKPFVIGEVRRRRASSAIAPSWARTRSWVPPGVPNPQYICGYHRGIDRPGHLHRVEQAHEFDDDVLLLKNPCRVDDRRAAAAVTKHEELRNARQTAQLLGALGRLLRYLSGLETVDGRPAKILPMTVRPLPVDLSRMAVPHDLVVFIGIHFEAHRRSIHANQSDHLGSPRAKRSAIRCG